MIQDFLTLSSFIKGFGPELVGAPVQEEDVVNSYEDEREGLTFYNYELKNHWLISATVYQRRVYIMVLHSSSLQWRRSYAKLLKTAASFSIPPSKLWSYVMLRTMCTNKNIYNLISHRWPNWHSFAMYRKIITVTLWFEFFPQGTAYDCWTKASSSQRLDARIHYI